MSPAPKPQACTSPVAASTHDYAWPEWLKFACIAICIPGIFLFSLQFIPNFSGELPFRDFAQEWTSARNFLEGGTIYPSLSTAFSQFTDRDEILVMDRNGHPPASVVPFIPFGWLDYDSAFILWNILSLGSLAISALIMIRQPGVLYSPWALLPIALLMISSNALAQHLHQGQLSLLVLMLITMAWASTRQENHNLAGGLIGAAAAIKLFPAFLLLYFLMRKKWAALASSVAAFVLLNLVALVLFGASAFSTYVTEVMPSLSVFRDYWSNVSLAGFWGKLFVGLSGHTQPVVFAPWVAKLGFAVCGLAVVATCAWAIWRARQRCQLDNAFMLCVIGMLLLSPITWDHYFVILLLPVVVLWRTLPEGVDYRVPLVIAAILLITLNTPTVWRLTVGGNDQLIVTPEGLPFTIKPYQTLTAISYQFYALSASFVALAAVLFRQDHETNTCTKPIADRQSSVRP